MITKGLEDYLEIIYNKISSDKDIKAVDIAHEFNVARSSVSEALIRLADMNLIIYEGRKGIKITPEGKIEAQKIIKKHKILSDFFSEILGIDLAVSEENACKIEHVINEEVIEKIKVFTDFCIEKSINKQFRKTNDNDK
ncbi:MAG: metal-dependent transcriptional regulator [Candidatus Gastranaerophilales bacterium]|nr:metal-dependent transcriptional regulator [Candidatus Gastranaerophilales bacterium]